MTESMIFKNKLEALKHARTVDGQFFESTTLGTTPETFYVVAASEHQANQALVQYLIPLQKWDKRKRDREYIAALEDAAEAKQ